MQRIVYGVLTSLVFALPVFAEEQPMNVYRLKVDADQRHAHVVASLWLDSPELSLFNVTPSPKLKNGQADLLKNLKIEDTKGREVTWVDKGEGDFEVKATGALTVRYDIRLEHDQHEWQAGAEEVSYRTDEGLMATGYSLFLAPSEKMRGPSRVEFDLPQGWLAQTPWRVTDKPHVFIADNRRELLNNALFMGTARAESFVAGGVQLRLVMGKRYWSAYPLFKELIDKQMHSYITLFGHPPSAQRYLIVVNQGNSGDGGAFSGSFSQYLKGDATLPTRPLWGRVVAHELLHFWNGISIAPADDREEWFKEGVTDYLTIKTLMTNGLVDRAYLMQWLENLSRGQMVARRAQGITGSVRLAAIDKHKNWLLVYGGGSIAALALDTHIAKATGNQKGLSDVMRNLFETFGKASKKYTLSDIVDATRISTGVEAGPLLSRLVESDQPVDLASLFADIGLQLEQYLLLEHFLLKSPQVTPEQQQRYAALFGVPY